MRLLYISSLFVFVLFSLGDLEGTYTLKEGKLINKEKLATLSVQEHFSLLMEAHERAEWDELVKQAVILKENFPKTPFAQEALFFLGVGHFHQGSCDFANQHLSTYLQKETSSKHFEEAIAYKFQIAEKFAKGTKKHLLGWPSLPKVVPANEDALAIYDEVISALPHHDLGARSLYGKAHLLFSEEEYQRSIEAFQTLIRRFPKHELTPESYLSISKVYFTQCKKEFPDPDLIDLSEINLKKFIQDFPSEPRIEESRKMLTKMQEIHARTLYETGRFYERTKKPHASIIYYSKIVAKYPETESAQRASKRLEALDKRPKNNPTPEPSASL
jgi:outer membrane protein assembly factor BamD (BamD/ComL family)